MVFSCEIRFDRNPHGVIYAGQMLSGSVVINLDRPKKLKGICFRISGSAKCSWTESQRTGTAKNSRVTTTRYSGREDYISTSSYLLPVNMTGAQQEIPAGAHTFTFACALPTKMPTSFEGTYGHIRYTARVILERPWKFDHTYRVAFTVLKELDLNLEHLMLHIPMQMDFTKNFCCGPCRTGPLSISATIPFGGYVPGQSIRVDTKVVNGSSINIDYMRYTLRKITNYRSQTPYVKVKTEVINIQESRSDGVRPNSVADCRSALLVPPVPATTTMDQSPCTIIQITYELKVEAKCSGPHQNAFVVLPVVIGTRPLRASVPATPLPMAGANGGGAQHLARNNFGFVMPQGDCGLVDNPLAMPLPSTFPAEVKPNADGHQNGIAISAPMEDDMPPPTYEETMHGNRQIEDEEDTHPIGWQSYTPRYPVYDFGEHRSDGK